MSSKWCCVLAVVCLSVILLSLDADAQPTVDDESSQCGSASLKEVANMVVTIASNQLQIENAVRDGIGGVRERIASECDKTNETMLVNEIRDVKRTIAFGCEETNVTTAVEEQTRDEIRDIKRILVSESRELNDTRLEEIVSMISVIASNQQEMKDGMQENVVEMRKMMDEMKNESDRVRAEMEDVKTLVLSRPTECECATVKPTDCSTCPSVTTTTSPPEHSTLDPAKQQRVSALVCEYAVSLWFHYTD